MDWVIILLALGLSMDAFAISMVNGMCMRIPPLKNALACGLAFGIAQGVMPLIGYLLGESFSDMVSQFSHWIALILLGLVGGKMVYESVKNHLRPEICPVTRAFSLRTLSAQAVATSIDALAVGVGLGTLGTGIVSTVTTIAGVTFICCFSGVFIGRKFGQLLSDKAEMFGGLILIFIGIRIFMTQ